MINVLSYTIDIDNKLILFLKISNEWRRKSHRYEYETRL